MKIEDLRKVYEGLTDHKLINLYREKETLNSEAIPVLAAELEKRGLMNQVAVEIPEEKIPYDFTDEELKEFVSTRIRDGESMASITIDLLEHGIDIKRRLRSDLLMEQEIIDYHLNQSAEGKNEQEIYADLKTKYAIDEDEIERIKAKHKPHGIIYLVVGIFLIIMGILGGCLFVYYDGHQGAQARYLLFSFSFFLVAYKSIKKFNVLRSSDPT